MATLEQAREALALCEGVELERAAAHDVASARQRSAADAYTKDPTTPKRWAEVEAAQRVVAQERLRLDAATEARERAQRDVEAATRTTLEARFAELVVATSPEQGHEALLPHLQEIEAHYLAIANAYIGIRTAVEEQHKLGEELDGLAAKLERDVPSRPRLSMMLALAHVTRVVSTVAKREGLAIDVITLPRPYKTDQELAHVLADMLRPLGFVIDVEASNRTMSAIEQVDGTLMGRDVRAEIAKRRSVEQSKWSPIDYASMLTRDLARRIRSGKLMGLGQLLNDEARLDQREAP